MAYKRPSVTMKKMFVLLFVSFLSGICAAQTPLSVLGINPNTTMKKFNLALSKKGIKPTQTAEGLYEYKVKFAGYPNCTMEVKFNIGNDSVRTVTIDIPHESFAKDKAIFDNLTKQFREKYGNERDGFEDGLVKEGLMSARKLTKRTKEYGQWKVNYCHVRWYANDKEYEDGVEVKYETNAYSDRKVSVSSDI